MESSDESFAWSNASSDNSDINVDIENLELAGKMKYEKNNLHVDELHLSSPQEEKIVEQNNNTKAKKRKTSLENNSESPKKKRIKIEPESDVDGEKSKTKIKQELNKSNVGDSETSFDDTYLDLCVKEEQASDKTDIKIKKVKKNKKKESFVNSDTENCKDNIEKVYEFEEDPVIEDKITIEEIVAVKPESNHTEYVDEDSFVKPKKKKKKHKRSICETKDITDNHIGLNNCSDLNEESVTEEQNDVPQEHSVIENGSEDELIENTQYNGDSKKNRKISDRIRFEDDTSEMECANHNDSTMVEENRITYTKKIKKYITGNPNLQQIKTKINKKHSVVTEMDEVWLVRCPRDIDITHLTGLKLDINSKSKIKIDGKNYDTTIDDNITRLPILSYSSENNPIIRNVKLNGCINLKKRLPKAHILENEIMMNNQVTFIPLPETKSRHPLFGIHYKKSIKVPADISKRLNENPRNSDEIDEARKKKKKHKEKKRVELDAESQETIKVEAETIHKKKKAKKRKYSEVEETAPTKMKRAKRDHDSAETWESEKAIEETLFNF